MQTKNFEIPPNVKLTNSLILTGISDNGEVSVTAITRKTVGTGREAITLIFNHVQSNSFDIIHSPILYNPDSVSLAINKQGDTVVLANTKAKDTGGIEVYKKEQGRWVKSDNLKPPRSYKDEDTGYGSFVELSSDGSCLFVVADKANTVFIYNQVDKGEYLLDDKVWFGREDNIIKGHTLTTDVSYEPEFYLLVENEITETTDLIECNKVQNGWDYNVIERTTGLSCLDYYWAGRHEFLLGGNETKLLIPGGDPVKTIGKGGTLSCKFTNKGKNIVTISEDEHGLGETVTVYDRKGNSIYVDQYDPSETSVGVARLSNKLVYTSLINNTLELEYCNPVIESSYQANLDNTESPTKTSNDKHITPNKDELVGQFIHIVNETTVSYLLTMDKDSDGGRHNVLKLIVLKMNDWLKVNHTDLSAALEIVENDARGNLCLILFDSDQLVVNKIYYRC